MPREIDELYTRLGYKLDQGSVARAKVAITGITQATRSARQTMEDAGRGIRMIGYAVTAVGGAMLYGVKESVSAAIEWESAFTGVRKTVDGTAQQMALLNKQIRGMATNEIPMSATEIAQVGEAAGQLGIQVPYIKDFTDVMSRLGVTTNLSAHEAATALARFANITGIDPSDYERLGSVIVDLGNNMATTESEIVEMGMRVAGAGTTAGMTGSQIMGIAATLSSVGIYAEMGGTAISRVIIGMEESVKSGNKKLPEFAKMAGMTSRQFSQAWRMDPSQALISFITGLGDAQRAGENIHPTLKKLGFSAVRVRDTLLRASQASDLFTSAMKLADTAWEQNTALMIESTLRFSTLASQIQFLKNDVFELGIVIGEILAPTLKNTINFLRPIIKDFAQFARDNPKVVKALAITAVALASIGATMIFVGLILGGLASIMTAFGFTAGIAAGPVFLLGAALWSALGPILLVAAAIASLIAVLVFWQEILEFFRESSFMRSIKSLTSFGQAANETRREIEKLGISTAKMADQEVGELVKKIKILTNVGVDTTGLSASQIESRHADIQPSIEAIDSGDVTEEEVLAEKIAKYNRLNQASQMSQEQYYDVSGDRRRASNTTWTAPEITIDSPIIESLVEKAKALLSAGIDVNDLSIDQIEFKYAEMQTAKADDELAETLLQKVKDTKPPEDVAIDFSIIESLIEKSKDLLSAGIDVNDLSVDQIEFEYAEMQTAKAEEQTSEAETKLVETLLQKSRNANIDPDRLIEKSKVLISAGIDVNTLSIDQIESRYDTMQNTEAEAKLAETLLQKVRDAPTITDPDRLASYKDGPRPAAAVMIESLIEKSKALLSIGIDVNDLSIDQIESRYSEMQTAIEKSKALLSAGFDISNLSIDQIESKYAEMQDDEELNAKLMETILQKVGAETPAGLPQLSDITITIESIKSLVEKSKDLIRAGFDISNLSIDQIESRHAEMPAAEEDAKLAETILQKIRDANITDPDRLASYKDGPRPAAAVMIESLIEKSKALLRFGIDVNDLSIDQIESRYAEMQSAIADTKLAEALLQKARDDVKKRIPEDDLTPVTIEPGTYVPPVEFPPETFTIWQWFGRQIVGELKMAVDLYTLINDAINIGFIFLATTFLKGLEGFSNLLARLFTSFFHLIGLGGISAFIENINDLHIDQDDVVRWLEAIRDGLSNASNWLIGIYNKIESILPGNKEIREKSEEMREAGILEKEIRTAINFYKKTGFWPDEDPNKEDASPEKTAENLLFALQKEKGLTETSYDEKTGRWVERAYDEAGKLLATRPLQVEISDDDTPIPVQQIDPITGKVDPVQISDDDTPIAVQQIDPITGKVDPVQISDDDTPIAVQQIDPITGKVDPVQISNDTPPMQTDYSANLPEITDELALQLSKAGLSISDYMDNVGTYGSLFMKSADSGDADGTTSPLPQVNFDLNNPWNNSPSVASIQKTFNVGGMTIYTDADGKTIARDTINELEKYENEFDILSFEGESEDTT